MPPSSLLTLPNRTITYVFLLDCGYAIFHNTPPRMSIAELSIPLTCHERLFRAPSAPAFAQELQSLKSLPTAAAHAPQMPLAAAIAHICAPRLSAALLGAFTALPTLGLFALASAFHALIHHLHALPPGCADAASAPIVRGLRNWRAVWAARTQLGVVVDEEDAGAGGAAAERAWRRTGFVRHAPEFWRLACIMVRRAGWGGGEGGEVGRRVELSGYDEADMGQMHRLIRRFQDVQLDI